MAESRTMLLFGGTGRAGQIVRREATASGWKVVAPTREECNLLRPEEVCDYVLNMPTAVVVNCAAISGLESCADDALAAHLVNAVSPAQMALACRHTGARFMHLSTDYVLDGRRAGKKREQAHCKPVSTYGESKREGELQVLEAFPEALILRVSWICGNPARPSFVETTLSRALRGESIAAIADKWSMPTHAADIARAMLELIPPGQSGVLHVCSTGEPLSWHDCARIALRCAQQMGKIDRLPDVEQKRLRGASFFREPRPVHTAMDSSRLREMGVIMPSGEETLRRAVKDFFFCGDHECVKINQ